LGKGGSKNSERKGPTDKLSKIAVRGGRFGKKETRGEESKFRKTMEVKF